MERATIRVIQVAVIAAAHESGSGLTARLSAGNPQGATTRITTIEDGGRCYNVVFLTQTGPKGRISRPRLPDCHACFHGEFRGITGRRVDATKTTRMTRSGNPHTH